VELIISIGVVQFFQKLQLFEASLLPVGQTKGFGHMKTKPTSTRNLISSLNKSLQHN